MHSHRSKFHNRPTKIMQEEIVEPADNTKKTKQGKKSKVQTVKASGGRPNLRRKMNAQSSQENLLPSQIPISSVTQLVESVGTENQLIKQVIRIPFALLKMSDFEKSLSVFIEEDQIQISVRKLLDQITLECQLSLTSQPKSLSEDKMPTEELQLAFFLWGRYVYLSDSQIRSKLIKRVRKEAYTSQKIELLKINVSAPSSDLLISLNYKAQQYDTDDFNGLINQGNTCYMNSYLQTLYHIPAFRNLVYQAEVKDESKFPATLQSLFFNLRHAQKAVSPEALVRSFGWSKKEASVQQDAQEFSCLFFEILQRKLQESAPLSGYKSMDIRALFKGQLSHYFECLRVGIQLNNFEQFLDIQLPIYPTLSQAFDAYTCEEHMEGENMLSTDLYGLQEAKKGIRISHFPPVLMIQLKRFLYDFNSAKNIKLLQEMAYEEKIDVAKWSTKPTQPQLYELYAVLVHEGSKAESGHYYNFVRSSEKWYKCNDESVQEVTTKKALNYNYGGFHETLEFDPRQMKVEKKFIESKSTAYMLVYISQQAKEKLMKDGEKYPEWLERQVQNRASILEANKTKKQFLHKITMLDWKTHLEGKSCAAIGFLEEPIFNMAGTTIQAIKKDSSIEAWLENNDEMQVEASSDDQLASLSNLCLKAEVRVPSQKQTSGLYAYYVTQEREVLVTFPEQAKYTMAQLLKDLPDPYLFKAPIQSEKEEFLMVCKKFVLSVNAKGEFCNTFTYDRCLAVNRQIQTGQLRRILQKVYSAEIHQSNGSEKTKAVGYNFYIDDQKLGCIEINGGNRHLPSASPSRNHLLVCIVELVDCRVPAQQQKKRGFPVWYSNKRSSLDLVVVDDRHQREMELKEIHQSTPLTELRSLIFSELIHNDPQIKSADNIVIKMKSKANSKLFTEVDDDSYTVKGLTKFVPVVKFTYSELSVQSRQSKQELIFYYRFQNLEFSAPIKMVVQKDQDSRQLVLQLKSHPEIRQFGANQGSIDLQVFLFSQDRHMINDVVDGDGRVLGKGELISVLKKEKNAVLVIEGLQTFRPSSALQMGQGDRQKSSAEEEVFVLIQHASSGIEKVGNPRHLLTDKCTSLSKLRTKTLDLILKDNYVYGEKLYHCNPFKIELRLFSQGSKKIVYLEDDTVNPTAQTNEIANSANDSSEPKGTQLRQEGQMEAEQAESQGPQAEEKNASFSMIKDFFKKSKVLRLQIVHFEMIKPNIPLKFNIDS